MNQLNCINRLTRCSLTPLPLSSFLSTSPRSRSLVSSTTKPFRNHILRSSHRRTTAMDPVSPAAAAASDDYVNVDGPISPVRHELGRDIESLVQSITSEVDEGAADGVDVERADGARNDVVVADEVNRDGSGDYVALTDVESGDGAGDVEERNVLPEELWRSVIALRCDSNAEGGVCNVYIVGTAHVSQESCEEVRAVVNHLKPQVVFLELCSGRVNVLTPQNLKVPTMKEMVEMWKKQHNLFGILYSWFLAKVATQLEVFPGAEFRVAFEEALKYGGKVILGDRPVQITLRRTWAKMPRWHKIKLIYSLLFQAVFLPSAEDLNKMLKEMDDVDMLTLVIQEMSKQYPTLMDTLVHERDLYMSSTLLKVASEHSSVVAVVGKGHLQGIKKNWKQPVELSDLLHVDLPSEKRRISFLKMLKTVGVAAAGAAIISGIYISCKK